jgi:hypothetical protein
MAVASAASWLLLAALLLTAPFKHAPKITASVTTHRAFDFMRCLYDFPVLTTKPNCSIRQSLPLGNVAHDWQDLDRRRPIFARKKCGDL